MQNTKTLRSYHRCVAFCTAESYDILGLAAFFKKKGYQTHMSKDVLQVKNAKRADSVFFFQLRLFCFLGIQ